MKKFDIIVIGAGPAGIMAAISASRNGGSVLLIEKNNIIGRKILATGNGRCNLTNLQVGVSRYHGADAKFIGAVLGQFDQYEAMKFFESLGLILKEEDKGRIFPRTNQASSVLEALTHELRHYKSEIKTECLVNNIKYNGSWLVSTEGGINFEADKLILTTGGKAAHQFGSSGDGLYWVEKLGHKVTEIYAGLVPIETRETWPKDIQGLKIEGVARVMIEEKIIGERAGDILFTHYGLSGPAIMGLARIIAPLVDDKKVEICIDAIPEENVKSLDEKIESIFKLNGSKSVKNALAGIVPVNLAVMVLKNLSLDGERKVAQISKSERMIMVNSLKNIRLTVSKIRPLKEAQVTAGGICASEIEAKTMGSKIIASLYFAGEIVDVDGDSGGFNLQWAWSSGFVAGTSAAKNVVR